MPRYDQAQLRAAILTQGDHLTDWLRALDPADWSAPSVLPEWTVTVLTGHVVGVVESIPALLARPTPDRPRPLVHHFPPDTAQPNDEDRSEEAARWAGVTPAAVLEALSTAVEAVRDALNALPLPAAIAVSRGAAATSDVLLTRVWELVVHTDDLGRSLPDRPAAPLDRTAVRFTVRGFADLLAARSPGHSVELRVPPYAAVQCIEGPRHTRGTPPNVVETDPTTWFRLATGRVTWAAMVATGTIRASGERSDLSEQLPLLG